MDSPSQSPTDLARILGTIRQKLHTLDQEYDRARDFFGPYVEILLQLTAAYPELSDGHALLGKWHRSQGDYREAVIAGHNALATDVSNRGKQAWLGRLLRECPDRPAMFAEVKSRLLKFHPPYIEIETINVCNAACVMCPASEKLRQAKVMPMPLFRKIIDEVAAFPSPPIISLHGIGEPLLDQHLAERITYARKKLRWVSFITNGSLISEEKARAILAADVASVTISIESTDATLYEQIRVNLKLEEVVGNVVRLARLRDELRPGLPIQILRVLQPGNAAGADGFEPFWRDRLRPGLDLVSSISRHNFAAQYDSCFVPSAKPCSKIFESMNLRSDGATPLCCVDARNVHHFGSVEDHTVLELYNADEFHLIRWQHLAGSRPELPLCGTCNVPETDELSVMVRL